MVCLIGAGKCDCALGVLVCLPGAETLLTVTTRDNMLISLVVTVRRVMAGVWLYGNGFFNLML